MPKPDFQEVKRIANGMLEPAVYETIHDTATEAKGTILEVGTAHGAATICMASASQNAVITIDMITGGSRDRFGDKDTNIKLIKNHFDHFDVSDKITLHIGKSSDVANDLDKKQSYGMLMLDADGAIDRDLELFYDQLVPGSPIVIDDYQPDFIRLQRQKNGKIFIDQKRYLTGLLVDYFVDVGVLEETQIVDATWFGRKPETTKTNLELDKDKILELYRKLSITEGHLPNALVEFISNTLRRFPKLHALLKKQYTKNLK